MLQLTQERLKSLAQAQTSPQDRISPVTTPWRRKKRSTSVLPVQHGKPQAMAASLQPKLAGGESGSRAALEAEPAGASLEDQHEQSMQGPGPPQAAVDSDLLELARPELFQTPARHKLPAPGLRATQAQYRLKQQLNQVVQQGATAEDPLSIPSRATEMPEWNCQRQQVALREGGLQVRLSARQLSPVTLSLPQVDE